MATLTDAQTDRFWSRVDQSGGPDACWLWMGRLDRNGYGRFDIKPRTVFAHRLALLLAGHDIEGRMACHRCDNPRCCNPSHLFLGSQADNLRDMAAKGRHWMQHRETCKNGHPWTQENTMVRSDNGGRRCRMCRVEGHRREYAALVARRAESFRL